MILTKEQIEKAGRLDANKGGLHVGTAWFWAHVRVFRSGAEFALAVAEERERVLVEALADLVRVNEEWNADVQKIVGRPPNWTDGYLNTAREALALVGEKGGEG